MRIRVADAFSKLFDELVPSSGNADTFEGELVRAVNKIEYRWYNDGDFPTVGYGVETSGPCLAFLLEKAPSSIKNKARALEDASYDENNGKFKSKLNALKREVVKYIEKQDGDFTKNRYDMLDWSRKADDMWKEEEEEEEYCRQCGNELGYLGEEDGLCSQCVSEQYDDDDDDDDEDW
jgi:hypothetical protein